MKNNYNPIIRFLECVWYFPVKNYINISLERWRNGNISFNHKATGIWPIRNWPFPHHFKTLAIILMHVEYSILREQNFIKSMPIKSMNSRILSLNICILLTFFQRRHKLCGIFYFFNLLSGLFCTFQIFSSILIYTREKKIIIM